MESILSLVDIEKSYLNTNQVNFNKKYVEFSFRIVSTQNTATVSFENIHMKLHFKYNFISISDELTWSILVHIFDRETLGIALLTKIGKSGKAETSLNRSSEKLHAK